LLDANTLVELTARLSRQRQFCSWGAKSALWTFGVIVMDRDLGSWCFVAVVAAFVALETALVIYGLS